MKIYDEFETIAEIIRNQSSIARYGDGELKLCIGKKQMSQQWSVDIQSHLKTALKAEVDNLLIGIPRIYNSGAYPAQDDKKKAFWSRYQKPKIKELYDPKKPYYSAFITLPDSAHEIDRPGYWGIVKEIWRDRDIVLLQGDGRQFHKDLTLLDTAHTMEVIYGPRRDAYEKLDELIVFLMGYPSDQLFILSLGPAATVLAYELARRGRQALDLGHMGMFYANHHPKSSEYTGEYYDLDKN